MYKIVFVTNLPSFYKINLYNEINKKVKIKVIFISSRSSIRNSDFSSAKIDFEHEFITDVEYEKRNIFKVFVKFLSILRQIKFERVVFSGWETRELIPIMLILDKSKNGIVIESSILESKTSGPFWLLKKIILNNMTRSYPSGFLQKAILDKASYKGDIFITNGVGITNYRNSRNLIVKKELVLKNEFKYLYVGRLSPEKNVDYIVDRFSDNKKNLTIVGSGPLLEELKSKASSNISFLGYIENRVLPEIFDSHDVLILPSESEAWGLVIDEALWHGIPVLVSNSVGCCEDLVLNTSAGIVFDLDENESFTQALTEMESNYMSYKTAALNINFEARNNSQINSYLDGELYSEEENEQ